MPGRVGWRAVQEGTPHWLPIVGTPILPHLSPKVNQVIVSQVANAPLVLPSLRAFLSVSGHRWLELGHWNDDGPQPLAASAAAVAVASPRGGGLGPPPPIRRFLPAALPMRLQARCPNDLPTSLKVVEKL